MENSQKVSLGTTLAGVNQYKVFSAVMNNFDQAIKSSEASLNANGDTLRQNAVHMESLEAKTNQLKQEFQKFVLGEGGLQSLGKWFVDLGTNILKIINDFGGLKTVIIALTGALITLNNEAIINAIMNFDTMIKNIASLGSLFIKTTIQTKSLSSGLQVLTASANTASIAFGAVTAVITIGLIAFQKYNQQQKEILQNVKESLSTFDSYQKSLGQTVASINDESATKSSLLQINQRLNKSYDDEVSKQKDIKDLRAENLRLLYEEAQAKAQATKNESTSSYSEAKKYLTSRTASGGAGSFNGVDVSLFDTPTEKLKAYSEAIQVYQDKLENGEKLSLRERNILKTLQKEYKELNDKISESQDIVTKYEEAQKIANMTYEEFINYTNESSKVGDEYGDLLDDTNDDIDDNVEKTEEQIKELEKLKETYSLASTQIDKLKENYETLEKAVNEINNSGKLSIETYESLISLSPAYIQALFDENGALRNNIDAQEELYKLKIEQMALDQAESLVKLAESYDGTTESLNELNRALKLNNDLTWSGLYSRIAYLQNEKELSADVVKALINQINTYQSWALRATKSISDYATKESDKATKSIVDDLNKQKDGVESLKKEIQSVISDLNDEVDKYKRVFAYLTSELDKSLDNLKEQKKEETEQLEKEIKAQETLKNKIKDYYSTKVKEAEDVRDKSLDSIEQELDLLDKQKSEEEDFWDKKINALKEQNDALKDQLEYEQLLENLAKAKASKVKVYRKGQGFVYETNAEEVNKAQQKINEFNAKKQYEDELASLKKNKEESVKLIQEKIDAKKEEKENIQKSSDEIIKNLKDEAEMFEKTYEKIIENLEINKQAVEEDYDLKISKIEEYKNSLQEQSNSYQTEQDRLLTLQMTGINTEEANWELRLNNLDDFVQKYNSKLAELANKQEDLNALDAKLLSIQTRIDNLKSDGVGSIVATGGNLGSSSLSGVDGILNFNDVQSKALIEAQKKYNEQRNKPDDSHLYTQTGLNNNNIIEDYYKAMNTMTYEVRNFPKTSKGRREYESLLKTTRTWIPYDSETYAKNQNGNNTWNELFSPQKLNPFDIYTSDNGSLVSTFNNGSLGKLKDNISNDNSTSISIGNLSLPNVSNANNFIEELKNFTLIKQNYQLAK